MEGIIFSFEFSNLKKIFNGQFDAQDSIIFHHIHIALCGIVIGVFIAFLLMNIASRFGRISTFLKYSDVISIKYGKITQYTFKRPRFLSEFFMLVIAYFYVRFTGKNVCIINPKIKFIVNTIWLIIITIVIYANIYLIDTIARFEFIPR